MRELALFRAAGDERDDFALHAGVVLVTDELRLAATLGDTLVDRDVGGLEPRGRLRALARLAHLLLEAVAVDRDPFFLRHFGDEIDRDTVGVVEAEDLGTVDRAPAMFADVVDRLSHALRSG